MSSTEDAAASAPVSPQPVRKQSEQQNSGGELEEGEEFFGCLSETLSREHLQLEALVSPYGLQLGPVILSKRSNVVLHATDIATKRRLVVKATPTARTDTWYNETELANLTLLGEHPNLVELWQCPHYAEPKLRFIVLGLMPGGDLLEPLLPKGAPPVREPVVWHVMRCLLRALVFLHSRHVIHNDVKLENLLCDAQPLHERSEIRLSDLGLSTLYLGNYGGSHGWVAPEKVCKDISPAPSYAADVFSAALCAFVLRGCVMPPLLTKLQYDRKAMRRRVQIFRKETVPKYMAGSSEALQQLVRDATHFTAAHRPTAADLLQRACSFIKQ